MLQIADLTVAYGPVVALTNVSATVRDAEIVCLLGSNSAGKTTLIRAAMGLKPPQSGSVSYGGTALDRDDVTSRVHRGIGWVPEGRGILGTMSVVDNLLMGAHIRRDRAGIAEDLDRVLQIFPVLAARRHQAAGTLSGGEQQMVALGRALMCRPKVILMDEPSMGLAPVIVEQVFGVIAEIHRQGVAVLLVEQNAHMALSIAQRFYVLQKGRIALEGEVSDGRLMVGNGSERRALDEDELEHAYLGG